ncbi:MAG TPA: Ku protein, partial [Chitinophagaceae bacterium]|nr:Ku protein [Chitinophagaceae bacterium]
MKSIWSGSIGFGLVTIPVKLFSAVQDSTLDMNLLDRKDHAHIRYKRVNEDTGKEVDWQNIVKAFNYEGKYVVLSDKEFEAVSPEKSNRVDIYQFVRISEIDSVYFETPYYLEPDRNGEKPYVLLQKALEQESMAAVGTFVLRNREHLVVIKPFQGVLVLNQIRFSQEIRDQREIKLPKNRAVKPAEMKMALELIRQMTGKFDITKFRDTYSGDLMKVIRSKAKGTRVRQHSMKVVHRNPTGLMEQLK